MRKKTALITGVTGQDGSYLAKFLLKKNYVVYGIKRRSSLINTLRIDDIYKDIHEKNNKFILFHGDMTDSLSIFKIIQKTKPDEIYNLAAQSHVAVSFEQPEYTANLDALGTLRILEIIKILKLKKTKFYQAGTSELFGGNPKLTPQNENTPFDPKSPYGVAKLYAHWITKNYRDSYKIFACNGILFNHESPVRGETFVTRKISIGLCKIKLGLEKKLYLGNIYAKRDWGHAKDFVEAQWLMLQQKKPEDYVIATGEQHSVKEFINEVAKNLQMKIIWKGQGLSEKGYQNGKVIIEIDKRYFRPLEVYSLLGDASKARKKLGWKPKIKFKSLVKEMVVEDLKKLECKC
jgi:GDPmannose 4,6-dehydratase